MNYLALSGGLHAFMAVLIFLVLGASSSAPEATYTIDFIGNSKVMATQGQDAPKAAAAEPVKTPEVKKEVAQPIPEVKKAEVAPKKVYTAKTEITTKPHPKKRQVLSAPSILDEKPAAVDKPEKAAASSEAAGEGEFEGGNIQTDFANFPYPWYITQVRNSMWSEWEKRRPVGNILGALVSFSIARDGKIKNLKVTRSSGDDTFDFAATSAVINAGPFQPLPMYYEKEQLTVTVEFKQEK